jgi:hypothetical protein
MPLSSVQTKQIAGQFDPLRKKAAETEAANLQTQKDALARRAAQLGGGPSGALIKQESLATDAMGRRLTDANEGINAQQTAALSQAREIQDQRDFQKSERVDAQKFAGAQFDKQYGLQKEQFSFQQKQYKDTKSMAEKEFEQNLKTNYINTIISAHNSKIPPDQMATLMDGLGIKFGPNGEVDVVAPDVAGLTKAKPVETKPAPMATVPISDQTVHQDRQGRKYRVNDNGQKIYFV